MVRLMPARRRASVDETTRTATQRLLLEAERIAQRRAGIARIVIALLLLGTVALAGRNVPGDDEIILRQVEAARVVLVAFGAIGAAVLVLASRGLGTRWLPFATATLDAGLILGLIAYNHLATDIPGVFLFSFPAAWVIPLALAANAVYYRPNLQLYAAALYLAGLPAIALIGGVPPLEERGAILARLYLQFSQPPNGVRLVMLGALSLILLLAVRQSRTILERAVRESALRLNLTRYLPAELAPVLTEDAFEGLRSGRRIPVALLFVDIRDSTALAESFDAQRLAAFITAFRRRVGKAARRHGGVVDKFLGDGALILFGVPAPRDDDPARALACARELLALVRRWNEKRGFDPPVRVGIGVHAGEVFCGVVGEESRREFTVLGEPVNVAARLQEATKRYECPLLASRDVVEPAGEGGAWEEVTREPLRGVTRSLVILRPSTPEA